MNKVALIFKIGPTDNGPDLTGQPFDRIDVASFGDYHFLGSGININGLVEQLKKMHLHPGEDTMDLLMLASAVFTIDITVSRFHYSQDSWTRELSLFVPVKNVELWNSQKELIQRILQFLTGDFWSIYFRDRSDPEFTLSPNKLYAKRHIGLTHKPDDVCLFSGGLDSFIGAIDLLSDNRVPLLVGHYKSADVSPFQRICHEALKVHFPFANIIRFKGYIRAPKNKALGVRGEEKTERGRSFLFFALGIICAAGIGSNTRVIVPENGLISLNLPLTLNRQGAYSTRTTHPYYIQLMNQLLTGLGLTNSFYNPYQFKTKGEMLSKCAYPTLAATSGTMSCSHPATRRSSTTGYGNRHCMHCVPCLIRSAAFQKAGLVDTSPNRGTIIGSTIFLSTKKSEGADTMAFKYMLEMRKRKPNYIASAIRLTGPLKNVADYVDLYNRGLDEVEAYISQVNLK